MNKLYFNVEELGNIKTNLDQSIEELDSILKKIKSRIDNMSTIWEGNAGESAYNKLKEMYGFFDILITNGTSYTGFLNEVITSYVAADTDNAN